MRRGGRAGLGFVLFVLVLASACTSGDDGEVADGSETEVGGAVLERDDDGEPTAVDDVDDERVDPRDHDSDPADDGDDEAIDDDAQDSGGAIEGADEPSSDAAIDGDQDAVSGDTSGSGAADGGDGSPGGDGSTAGDGGTTGERAERRGDAAPAPAPSPAPAPGPAPQPLAAGPGLRGDLIGFGEDGTEILVSAPLERPPPVGARSDAVRVGQDDDRVRCETFLQAPQDRGLTAQGELLVSLLIDRHDGTSQRVRLLAMDLSVELAAGESFVLPETRPREFDRATVATLACEANFTPR